MVGDHRAGEHAAWVAHHALQHGELLGRQFDGALAALHALRAGVEREVTGLEHGALGRIGRPAQQRTQPCQQFAKGKRLHQVVVGAGIQPVYTVIDGVAGGQHQHRRLDALAAQLAAEAEPVQPRQHHVEDEQVIGRRERPVEPVAAVIGCIDGVAFLFKTPFHVPGDLVIVFH